MIFDPPYYAVIFSSQRAEGAEDYAETAHRMMELAQRQPGYLGLETSRNHDGFGITISYWRSLEDIAAWKADAEHREAQRQGRERWYASYTLQVARVERAESWAR